MDDKGDGEISKINAIKWWYYSYAVWVVITKTGKLVMWENIGDFIPLWEVLVNSQMGSQERSLKYS